MVSRSRKTWVAGGALLAGALTLSCGGGSMSTAGPTAPTGTIADVTVTITGMNGADSFSPNNAQATVGNTVAWHNADSIAHTATGQAFDTGVIAPGATSAPIRFTTAATFLYRCTIHPTMTGSVQVGGSTTRVGY
jgi:plastocyanin